MVRQQEEPQGNGIFQKAMKTRNGFPNSDSEDKYCKEREWYYRDSDFGKVQQLYYGKTK